MQFLVKALHPPSNLAKMLEDEGERFEIGVHKNIKYFMTSWGEGWLYPDDVVIATKVWNVNINVNANYFNEPDMQVYTFYKVRGWNADGKRVKGWVWSNMVEKVENPEE